MPSATDSSDSLRLDRQLCFALYSASLAMSKAYKPHLDALGLTYPQYVVMLALWETDGLTVSEIGERVCLDSGTLTPLLKRLEAASFIARKRDAHDERRVIVALTPLGRRLQSKAAKVPACILKASGCSPAELSTLTERLKLLRAHLLQDH